MSFDIQADEITYNGIPFATINGKCWPTLLDEAMACLETMPADTDWISGPDHLKELDAAESAAFDNGQADGELRGRAEAEKEFDAEREKIEEAAFNEGRSSGVADSGRAGDVARIDPLLAAMEKAEALIRAPLNGVKEPNAYKGRPAKVSELRREMVLAMRVLSQALVEYRSE